MNNMTIYSFLGDFYHEHDHSYPSVKKAVEANNAALADCKLAEISAVIDQNPAAIILGCENRINPEDDIVNFWLTSALDEKITAYVRNGGLLVVLHAALASYPEDSKYVDMVKGYFISHPEEHCKVRYMGKLPLASSAAFDYEIMDEFYIVHVNENETNIYMRTESAEHGKGIGGWYHSYGAGKVIVIIPTHRQDGYEHPETIRLISEGLAWALSE